MDSDQPSTQRRRSERISKNFPLIVRGTDLLGQPFEERTTTVNLNLHGCRYSSKHHLPKNTWVTLELLSDTEGRNLRARVAWIQRPHSVRDFFQVAVELEGPANVWSIASPPPDWVSDEALVSSPAEPPAQGDTSVPGEFEISLSSEVIGTFTERMVPTMTNPASDFASNSVSTPVSPASESSSGTDSPLLREWNAEFERQASRAAEQIHESVDEFERMRDAARESFSAEMDSRREEFINGLKSQLDGSLEQARELVRDLDRAARDLRAEKESGLELTSRIAQAQLQFEATHAARSQQQATDISRDAMPLTEDAAANWRRRLESEMTLAQAQWNELLQSSLDGGIERLVAQLSTRSQDVLRDSEQKMSERFADLRAPLGHVYTEARETLSGIKLALEQEVGRARFSLSEIEHAASRMKEYSAQLEAASHDTLNELHRRLENILEAQTDEMNRRAEGVAAGVPQRLAPSLDSLGQQFLERTMGEVESRLNQRVERIPELLRELASREVQAEDSLRLHRERLRQVSENNHREAVAQMSTTLSGLRHDFESARKEALTKWSEELDTTGVRATHAAAESIGKSSEWFQQEARARLQVLVEQALATAGASLEAKIAEGTSHLEARLEEQFNNRLGLIHQQLDGVAVEVTGRTRTQLDAAAEAAAASFGQVLHEMSDHEARQFAGVSRSAMQEREQELKRFTEQLAGDLEASARGLTDRFHAQMGSQLEASVIEGRSALATEFAHALDGYRTERDAHDKEWAQTLDRVSGEAVDKYQDRLQSACDSWVVSSVRRLNEHGQNVVESLMRSADQSLRDSCSKVFEGLSEMLRDRGTNAVGVAGFAPGVSHDPETPTPHNQSSMGASA